jgi:hypothetical protein
MAGGVVEQRRRAAPAIRRPVVKEYRMSASTDVKSAPQAPEQGQYRKPIVVSKPTTSRQCD